MRVLAVLRYVAFGLAVAVQLVVLYSPDSGGPPPFPNADKVVHVVVFALVGCTGVLARIRWLPLLVALLAHGVVSEVVQATLLAGRSGSAWDLAADAGGAALGVLVAASWTRGTHWQPARRDSSAE